MYFLTISSFFLNLFLIPSLKIICQRILAVGPKGTADCAFSFVLLNEMFQLQKDYIVGAKKKLRLVLCKFFTTFKIYIYGNENKIQQW